MCNQTSFEATGLALWSVTIDKKKDILGWIFKDNKSAKVKPMSSMPTNKKYKKYIKIVYKTKEQKRKEMKEVYIKELIVLQGQRKNVLVEIAKINNGEKGTQRA